jgi:hypothetical protein
MPAFVDTSEGCYSDVLPRMSFALLEQTAQEKTERQIMIMKCIEQLKVRAANVGASLDDNTDYALNLDAPSGYVWRASGTTCLSEQAASNSETWYDQAATEIIKRAEMGLQLVRDAAELAEIRHVLDDDSWGAPDDAPATLKF